MSNNGDNATLDSEQSFAELLGHAVPRPAPSAEDTRAARDAVREEWLKVANKRKSRRLYFLAAAASVVLALALVINLQGVPTASPIEVATIEHNIGSIYVLGEESRLQATGDLSSIAEGQTIVTGDDSALGLMWSNAGSLRLDANSRVLFVSASSIELQSGRIYFDSMDGASELVIKTRFGGVQHIGTQFMTSVDSDSLSVSVRDGRVAIDGVYFEEIAEERQRVTFRGSSRAEVLDILPYGEQWEWIEATAPVTSFDGKTLYRFLQWVAHETGFEISYASPEVEEAAKDAVLRDEVSSEPRKALGQRLITSNLDYEFQFEKGVIQIIERKDR